MTRTFAISVIALAGAVSACSSVIGADFDDAHLAASKAAGSSGTNAKGGSALAAGNGSSGAQNTNGGSNVGGSSPLGAGGTNPVGAGGTTIGPGGNTNAGGATTFAGNTNAGGAGMSAGSPTTGGAPPAGGGSSLDGGATSDGGSSATGGAAGAAVMMIDCPPGKGSAMVGIAITGGALCVDAFEATNADYAAFVADGAMPPAGAAAPTGCNTKTSYLPDAGCLDRIDVCQSGCDAHPQVCVDGCDAAAFCAWAGKRLCGKIGGGPGGFERGEIGDPQQSEWMAACSSNGNVMPFEGHDIYVYGDEYVSGVCNTEKGQSDVQTVPVGMFNKCESAFAGYEGIFDLNGNAQEWEDRCGDDGAGGIACILRGGAASGMGQSSCGDAFEEYPVTDDTEPNTGIRCCADPVP